VGGWARSICPNASRVHPSCRARSIRSSPRRSTVWRFASSAATPPEAGQLQLNAFEPGIIWSLHEAATLLTRGADALRLHCVDGIVADSVRCGRNLAQSTALAAELVPHLGYARAAEIAQYAQESGDLIASVRLRAPEWSEFIAQKASADFALAHP